MTSAGVRHVRVPRDRLSGYYEVRAPTARVAPGGTAIFETVDARNGSMFSYPVGTMVDFSPSPPVGKGNPLSGPLHVEGAEPGDALVVDIHEIKCITPAFTGTHATVHPLSEGRIPRALARICDVSNGVVQFNDTISFPAAPMLGCIGTATTTPGASAGVAGPYGGNLDHPVIRAGVRVYLPVLVSGALLYIGDVHAAQGDGEISCSGIEIAADVSVTVKFDRGSGLSWPWVETSERTVALASGATFDEARRQVISTMLSAFETQLKLEPAEALALLSAVGDLRIGQACGIPFMTMRLEVPRALGVRPA